MDADSRLCHTQVMDTHHCDICKRSIPYGHLCDECREDEARHDDERREIDRIEAELDAAMPAHLRERELAEADRELVAPIDIDQGRHSSTRERWQLL